MPAERDWLSHCLALPGAWRDEPWDNDVVAKVGGKIFAFFGGAHSSSPSTIGLKCGDREAADLWVDRYPGSVRKMAYIGAHGWNTFDLDGTVGDDDIEDLIEASYEMVVAKLPRKLRPAAP